MAASEESAHQGAGLDQIQLIVTAENFSKISGLVPRIRTAFADLTINVNVEHAEHASRENARVRYALHTTRFYYLPARGLVGG